MDPVSIATAGKFVEWGMGLLKGLGIVKDPKEEKEYQLKLLEFAQKDNEFYARLIESVNATMREEARSEHWAQWLWRPVIGFTFALVILNNYVLMPYFQRWLQPIVIPDRIFDAMLIILGAAAATRGWQKVEQAKAQNGSKNGGGISTHTPQPEAPKTYRNSVLPSETPRPERGLEPGNRVSEGLEYLERFGGE